MDKTVLGRQQGERMRLIIADDQAAIVEVTRCLLAVDFDVIATVDSGVGAFVAITRLQPDCAVLDISMPDVNGIEVAKRLKAAGSTAKIVFLTVHEDPDFVDEAVAAGGLGYVVKSRIGVDLKTALCCAIAGDLFVSPSIKMN